MKANTNIVYLKVYYYTQSLPLPFFFFGGTIGVQFASADIENAFGLGWLIWVCWEMDRARTMAIGQEKQYPLHVRESLVER